MKNFELLFNGFIDIAFYYVISLGRKLAEGFNLMYVCMPAPSTRTLSSKRLLSRPGPGGRLMRLHIGSNLG